MPAFQPTGDQFRALRDDPHEGPIAQVNLLKFKVKAMYQPDDPEFGEDCSGETAYIRYSEAFSEAAKPVGGETTLLATTERYFIGGGDWDAVLVNSFPVPTCTWAPVWSSCGPWPPRVSPPCKRGMIPPGRFISAPILPDCRFSSGKSCPVSPSS